MKNKNLADKPDLAKIQEEVLNFWEDNKIFEKSLSEDKPEVVFYDGPPFPTGKPHHGTVLVSFIKDMIARYWTMNGYSVPRVWGWDCHGLPIENQVETLMGITDKNEIENSIGIDVFNENCYDLVSQNNDSWEEYVREMARWVDYKGAYKTMDKDYMESVMWAFKQLYDKGLIYRDYRVTPYCTHCETSLSISDTRESDSTHLRQDRWVLVRFKTDEKIDGKDVYFTSWTTTPWTLPSNLALTVGKDIDYAYVDTGDSILIASKDTLANFKNVFGDEPKIIKEVKGSELEEMTYEPLFDYFKDLKDQGAYRVILGDFVGSDEGVGIVHTAPAFGEDDYWISKENNIPFVNPVDEKGHFTEEVVDFYSPEPDKTVIELNSDIIRFLYGQEKALADGTIEHNYPHCWRCKNPLIYKAMDAWYLDINKIKDELLEQNEKVNWIPETIKHGRFGHWLENARDWNISRNRYWSTPIPIWECDECGERVVLGSIDEIEEKSGVRPDDLHRQYLDKIEFKCEKCGGTMHRIPEVLDCWFESGSVPFAQKHYPFENKEWFESHFPSDFIVEYTGQIRCWFYYLHVLATALFGRNAFTNCIVHGTILAKDGKKLSKSSKNYTDPMELMKTYGTDALRLYLFQSNAVSIGDLLFDESGIQEALQQNILPLWNAAKFFKTYALIDGFEEDYDNIPNSDNYLDQWILANLYKLEKDLTNDLNKYEIGDAVKNINSFLNDLTNWYIRRSRRRFWSSGLDEDKLNAYNTLYYVLVNLLKLLAPFAPIVTEELFGNLTDKESIHLEAWPEIPEEMRNDDLIEEIGLVQEVVTLGRSIRNKNNIKNRQPLNKLQIAQVDSDKNEIIKKFEDIILEELNIKSLEFIDDVSDIVEITYKPNFKAIRELYPDSIKQIIQAIQSGKFTQNPEGTVTVQIDGEDQELDSDVLLVNYKSKQDNDIAHTASTIVALDTTIDDELKEEGLIRDLIRNIQDARKKLGCELTDRIYIELEGDFNPKWNDVISQETLSNLVEIDDADMEFDLNGIHVKIKKEL